MFNNNTPLQKSNKSNHERLQDDYPRGGKPVGGAPAGEGLSYAHIRPRSNAKFWTSGNLIKVETGKEHEHKGGGKRGKVIGLSRGARRRMMYALCMTEKRNTPLMVTLTYPDEFNPSPRVWARDLKVFLQRLGREFPTAAGFWREELKRRLSGQNIGKIAPHFHLLVWGVDYIDMWSFVAHAWWAVVGSMNDKHLKAGTRVDLVHSVDGIKRYASKYASKADNEKELYLEASKLDPVGRVWGMFNQDKIPWSECYEMETTNAQANDLLRLMRRYAHIKMRSNTPSMTLMVNDPLQWMRPLLC